MIIQSLVCLFCVGLGGLIACVLMIPRMDAYESKIKRLEIANSNCTCS